jgi:DNA-binding transcriptional regulator YhcF (GntR family)
MSPPPNKAKAPAGPQGSCGSSEENNTTSNGAAAGSQAKSRHQTKYTPPTKGQKTAALHVAARSNLSRSAIRLFSVLVWMTNTKTGQLDPSQELLADETKMHVNTVARALKELKRASFIVQVRKPRPHHSEGFQIQWSLLAEAQRRWEIEAATAMAKHRRLRADKIAAYRTPKPTDTLPANMKCSPTKRLGYPQPNDWGKGCPNPQPNGWVNSNELFESNSRNGSARSDEPSPPKRGSSSLAERGPSGESKGQEPSPPQPQNHVGHFDDPRIVALETTERRILEQKQRKRRTA